MTVSLPEVPPRCRDLDVLAEMIDERAAEFPDRVEDWRQFLERVREDAVEGVLPASLDPVLRTVFRDLLFDAPEPPPPPPPVLPPAAVLPLADGWEVPRPLESWTPAPAAEQPPPAPKQPKQPKQRKQPRLRRELHLPRPNPRLPRRRGDALDVLGLRIGSSQIAAALVHNNGSAELRRLARAPIAPGLVADGEVRDADALAAELRSFFSAHRLPRRGIRLGIATNRIGVRVLEVPAGVEERAFANAVRFHAQDVVPIPLREAVLDHVVLDEHEEDGSTLRRVLVVFAHRELVDGYVAACSRAGLRLAGIDFDAFALLRALGGEAEGSALVAVAIGHERTIFAVSEGPVCDFARVLDWGGGRLDAAVAESVGIGLEEAAALKQALSLDAADGDGAAQAAAARAAMRGELQVLARELVSSLRFYQSRPGSLDIGELLLTGGGSELGGLAGELERQTGVPVRVADPLGRVALAAGCEPPEAAGSLAIAVGLGIEGA